MTLHTYIWIKMEFDSQASLEAKVHCIITSRSRNVNQLTAVNLIFRYIYVMIVYGGNDNLH